MDMKLIYRRAYATSDPSKGGRVSARTDGVGGVLCWRATRYTYPASNGHTSEHEYAYPYKHSHRNSSH
jgi:hypothetical protein